MDDEVDLSHYIRALLWGWRWILVAAIIGAGMAVGVGRLLPKTYSASASVFFRSTRSEVTLDQRFVTSEAIDFGSRRQGLLALAESETIEHQIPMEMRQELNPDGVEGALLDQIKVKPQGDFIVFTAVALSPEQARALANVWAESFVTYVNQLYGEPNVVDANLQIQGVQRHYDDAQTKYEQFIGSNRMAELDQRIRSVTGVLTQTLEIDRSLYRQYLARAEDLEIVVRDAEALRSEFVDGQPSDGSVSQTLLFLRMRAAGSGSEGPAIQFLLGQGGSEPSARPVTLAELDAFIGAVRQDLVRTRTVAGKMGTALAQDASSPDRNAASDTLANYYDELLKLQREREIEEGQRMILAQERDLALEALQIVRRKLAEQQVAAVQPDAEVRLVDGASLPGRPSGYPTLLLIFLGIFVGMSVGLLIVLIRASRDGGHFQPARQRDDTRDVTYPTGIKQA